MFIPSTVGVSQGGDVCQCLSWGLQVSKSVFVLTDLIVVRGTYSNDSSEWQELGTVLGN